MTKRKKKFPDDPVRNHPWHRMTDAQKDEKRRYERERYANLSKDQRELKRAQGRVAQKSYRARNRKRVRETVRKWRDANREKVLVQERANKYGVDAEWIVKQTAAQSGLCYVCRRPRLQSLKRKTLEIDHDHFSGAVRKLLCTRCNRTVGAIETDTFFACYEYVIQHSPARGIVALMNWAVRVGERGARHGET